MLEGLSRARKGDHGLGTAIHHFTSCGYIVSIPLTDSQKYDLIIDNGENLSKIQVRSTTSTTDNSVNYLVKLTSTSFRAKGKTNVDNFHADHFDYLFVECGDGSCYLIPSGDIKTSTSITLNYNWEEYKIVEQQYY